MTISIIGAGAAGCFAAIEAARRMPQADICVYESLNRPLAKVAITGGGRCNLTNSFQEVRSLETVYPRGARLMKRLFHTFDHRDTMRWFEAEGVPLTVQDDQCVFPRSQDAQDIVGTLLRLMKRHGIAIKTSSRAESIEPQEGGGYKISFANGGCVSSDAVIVTTGGSPRADGAAFLNPLLLKTVPPVPSLFSFALEAHPLKSLMGIVVANVTARLAGTKFKTDGPLLITHWGVSGPAILKLSSHAARHLAECSYRATLALNWLGDMNEAEALDLLKGIKEENPQKQLASAFPRQLGKRLWLYLLEGLRLPAEQKWASVGTKDLRRLAAGCTNHLLPIAGRNRHKEEFVTCGGVALSEINPSTLECRRHPRLFFAGEVLDVDAVTGGFNLQAAWTMGYVTACNLLVDEEIFVQASAEPNLFGLCRAQPKITK